MNNQELKYNFSKLIKLIAITELIFWASFLGAHVLISLLKNEPIIASFLVYQNPDAFWWFMLLPVFYFVYLNNLSWKNSVLDRFFSPKIAHLLFNIPSLKVSFWRFFILRTALVFIILAIANPQGGKRKLDIEGYSGEFVVAVDISKSMLVRDMDQGKSRLEAAKNGLGNMVRSLDGTSMGIVVFAGSAFTFMPMTKDSRNIQTYVDDLSTEYINDQGTHLADAIRVSLSSFSNSSGTKMIVLISDGEDHEGGVEEAIQNAINQNAVVHVVALGTQNGGPIPEKKGGVKKDAAGEVIISKPNFEILQSIAQATGGSFLAEKSAYPNLARLVKTNLKQELSSMKMESSLRKSFGIVFALKALLLILIYFILSHFNIGNNEI